MTPQNLARGRLLLQSFGKIAVALLQFLEQPHVLDGDDRLIGEGFQQRDLFVRKRTDFRAANMNRPNRNTFAQQRRRQNGPTAILDMPSDVGKLRWRGEKIRDMHHLPVNNRSSRRRPTAKPLSNFSERSPFVWAVLRRPYQIIAVVLGK